MSRMARTHDDDSRPQEQKVLAFLLANLDERFEASDVADAWGIPRESANDALADLGDLGVVKREGSAWYLPWDDRFRAYFRMRYGWDGVEARDPEAIVEWEPPGVSESKGVDDGSEAWRRTAGGRTDPEASADRSERA